MDEYTRINPTLFKSDIGIVSYLMQTNQVYFQIAVGANPLLIAKISSQTNLTNNIKKRRIATIIKENEQQRHIRPKINRCPHVAHLVTIRKIKDDIERFQELTKYYKKYQGVRDLNWINCNSCSQHLLCMHERLQIQSFLNKNEQESIDKEIILMYSGGQFQGKYICKNCGQPIKDIDFDNNMEFDDNGKPKSGRAVLIDEDAVFQEKLDLWISPDITKKNVELELDLNDDTKEKNKYYSVIHDLSAVLGISLTIIEYNEIIKNVFDIMNKVDTIEEHNKKRESNAGLEEYNEYISRLIIISCASYLLIHIQSKIPSYIVRPSSLTCESPGYNGYPLDIEKSNVQGILYIVCAIISFINKNEEPWVYSGYNRIKEKSLRKGLTMIMSQFISNNINNTIELKLSEKRKYVNIFEKSLQSDRNKDIIPATFLPEQIIAAPDAENPITPEVAALMNQKGERMLSMLWIRQAHTLAKGDALITHGSPYMETTCCTSSIETPRIFWKQSENTEVLPKLNVRKLSPVIQGSFLVPNFIPRETNANVIEPDSDFFYRLFLKCCFVGPRIGHLHEVGLSYKCIWCAFQFPTDPTVMDIDTEGKAALLAQDVKTDTDAFVTLLDRIHTINSVGSVKQNIISPYINVMKEFSEISTPPIHNWNSTIYNMIDKFVNLPPDVTIDIIINDVLVDISNISTTLFNNISSVLKENAPNIKAICEIPWINFFNIIQNYFLIPIQRIVYNFKKDKLKVPLELVQSLSQQHVTQAIVPILVNDLYLLDKKDDIRKSQFILNKLSYFITQLSACIAYKNKIRSEYIPGKQLTLKYIQQMILYGSIASLLNINEIPPNTTATLENMTPKKYIKEMSELILSILNKYNKEKLSFNDQEIKRLIEIRDEKERVHVIAEFDKLTDEERTIELINKHNGTGKWAVGGTKKIYAYDKDYYDLERQKRMDAGIIDFPGLGNGEMNAPEGRKVDASGFPIFNDNEYEEEGGYDHNQDSSDD